MTIKPVLLEGNYSSHFVNKHGIAYSCDRYPKILSSDQREIDPLDYENINDGDRVYVITSALPNWFKFVYPRLLERKIRIILVTGDSIQSAPLGIFSDGIDSFENLMRQGIILHWFCQNCDFPDHDQITPIPLGIDYHTRHRGKAKGEPSKSFFSQDANLIQLNKGQLCRASWVSKKAKIFVDAHLSKWTNPADREEASIVANSSSLFELLPNRLPREDFWMTMRQFRFVLSPLGAGLDCHRTWEALALGCVPILKKTSISSLFEGLPILWVDDYRDINAALLDKVMVPEYWWNDQGKLLMLDYWVGLIMANKRNYLSNE